MMAANSAQKYQCRQCEFCCTTGNKKRDMVTHLRSEANRECLVLYSKSTDKREMLWVSLAQDQ